jgi:hypothetical protein
VTIDFDDVPLTRLADPHRITTKEGWRRFAAPRERVRPEPRPLGGYRRMAAAARAEYDERRLDYHSNLPTIETNDVIAIHYELKQLVIHNARVEAPNARVAAMIDGYGGLGKTTIMTEFGRRYEQFMRGRAQAIGGLDEFVPVAYTTLSEGSSRKTLNQALAQFYAIPFDHRTTKDALGWAVEEAVRRCRTSLLLIDDFHSLELRHKEHRQLNSHIKHLANILPLTLVFAGIGLEHGGLLNDGHGEADKFLSQTRRRIKLLQIAAYATDKPEATAEWRNVIASFEQQLVLLGAEPGVAHQRHWKYLYERTAGSIGALRYLLVEAANRAIADGSERLTQTLFDEVVLPKHAEAQPQPPGRPSERTRRKRRVDAARRHRQRAVAQRQHASRPRR